MLTEDQVNEAIVQMMAHCDLKMAQYEAVSARGALNELGFSDDADQIISHLAEGGFTYCLDPQISATHYDPNNPQAVNGMVTDYPDADACYWGPDQLKSRLQSLSNVPYWVRHGEANPTRG